MQSLNETLAKLAAANGKLGLSSATRGADRLGDLSASGSNPGALRGHFYVPADLQAGAALVVVLHGCTQDAVSYDLGSGWSRLADEQGFAVLYPEQQRSNNPNGCFNWFTAQDTRRDSGEPLSIRQMVEAMIAAHRLDPGRVFVTGLSAGGAMASVLLATYPEVFAGGAIIAGLPFGTARTVPEAFERMRAHGGPEAAALGRLVTAASAYNGPWPTISVWHGDRDTTVSPDNAALVVAQWRAVHGVALEPTTTEQVDGHRHSTWRDAAGREVIEEYRIVGLEHGTPLSTLGAQACGAVGPFMLEAGISSTRRIADFWGLLAPESAARTSAGKELARRSAEPSATRAEAVREPAKEPLGNPNHASGVKRVIEDALRTAGLMR